MSLYPLVHLAGIIPVVTIERTMLLVTVVSKYSPTLHIVVVKVCEVILIERPVMPVKLINIPP